MSQLRTVLYSDIPATSTDSTQVTQQQVAEAFAVFRVASQNYFYNEGLLVSTEAAAVELGEMSKPPTNKDVIAYHSVVLDSNDTVVAVLNARINCRTGTVQTQCLADPSTGPEKYHETCSFGMNTLIEFAKSNASKVSPSVPMKFTSWVRDKNTILESIVKSLGLTVFHSNSTMYKDIANDPIPPYAETTAFLRSLGYELRPYDAEAHVHKLHVAHQVAFRDYALHDEDEPFDTWLKDVSGPGEGYDPSLFYVLWSIEKDEIVGGVLAYDKTDQKRGKVFVYQVFVLREARRKGVGSSLMQAVFADLKERKMSEAGEDSAKFTHVALAVDETSSTNAMRLYEKVGMIRTRGMKGWHFVLRPAEE